MTTRPRVHRTVLDLTGFVDPRGLVSWFRLQKLDLGQFPWSSTSKVTEILTIPGNSCFWTQEEHADTLVLVLVRHEEIRWVQQEDRDPRVQRRLFRLGAAPS